MKAHEALWARSARRPCSPFREKRGPRWRGDAQGAENVTEPRRALVNEGIDVERSSATVVVESLATLTAAGGVVSLTAGATPVVAVGWRGDGRGADITPNTITGPRSGREDDVRQ